MLLLFYRQRSHRNTLTWPRCFFIRKYPFTISASRHADLILNDPGFRDRCLTLRREHKTIRLHHGGQANVVAPHYHLTIKDNDFFFFQGVPNFRRLKYRSAITVGLCTLLMAIVLKLPPLQALPTKQTIHLPFFENIAINLKQGKALLGLQLPKRIGENAFISFYLDAPENVGPIQLGNVTFNPVDLQWKGKHILPIHPDGNKRPMWLKIQTNPGPLKRPFLEMRNVEIFEGPGPERCQPEEIKPLSDFEKLERMGLCYWLHPGDAFFTLESVRALRQSLSQQVAALQFDYVRAKNLGDLERSRALLAGVIRTLPDPLDPRNQQAKYLLERKGPSL